MINKPKGTKDILPSEIYKWEYVENIAKQCLRERNFKEIRTPVFEHTELFVRGVGDGSDIVNKEMYTFLDKGERSITLKPEGTASIVRALIENGLDNEPMPQKLFMETPCFRYEKPQSGRLREHHQISIEALGSFSPVMDFEVISLVTRIFDKLGFQNYILNLNSIGCKECRKEYVKALKEYYAKHIDEMCEDCKVRFEKNTLRLLDCKEERCSAFKKDAPKPKDFLCEDCKNHFETLVRLLKAGNINFVVNDNVVRGIDYYSRTVFEFMTDEGGALSTICGGGRYDGLVSELGGKDLPGVGVGLGLERILILLEKNDIQIPEAKKLDLYVANASPEELEDVVVLSNKLRNAGASVEFDSMNRSLKSQMKYANKLSAKYVMIVGSSEIETRNAKLKDMNASCEIDVSLDDIDKILKIIK